MKNRHLGWYPGKHRPFNHQRDDDGWYQQGSILAAYDRDLRDGLETVPDPLAGAKVAHLHLRHLAGGWYWMFVTKRNSVCKTKRCVPLAYVGRPGAPMAVEY